MQYGAYGLILILAALCYRAMWLYGNRRDDVEEAFNRYVFEKNRMVRLGVFCSGEFEGMRVRMDLEGQ